MNVKQGDLAFTVCPDGNPVGLRNSGRIVEVLRFVGHYRYAGGHVGVNTWRVKLHGRAMRAASNRAYQGEVYIDDANLRPIRDPGEDARDETLDWLDVPAKELA